MAGVLCTGNLVMDILVRPVESIAWGTTTQVESMEQHMGGNGAATSYAVAMLGVPARLLGMVGPDAFGDQLVARLAGAGVQTSGVRRAAAATATTVVLVRGNGDRHFLHRRGASDEMDLDETAFRAECRAGWTHYHLASPFGLPRLRDRQAGFLRAAREAGLATSIDTHWDAQGRWMEDLEPCLPYTDVLFANEDEARMLSGSGDPETAAAFLRARGAGVVVVKLSRAGCALFGPGLALRCPAFSVPVVDTTGAGDCFVGGFLAARQRGLDWEHAARFANAVAALSIQHLGGTEGLRSWDETERFQRAAATRWGGPVLSND